MKKPIKLILPILTAITATILSGCNNGDDSSENEKNFYSTDLVYGQLFNEQVFAIDSDGTAKILYATLSDLVNNKESFIVVTRGSYPCACWDSFVTNCLKPYIGLYNLKVYLIDNKELSKNNRDDFGIQYSNSDHNIAIFNKGKIAAQKLAKYEDSFSSDFQTFKTWMDKYIGKKPTALYVTKSQLDSLYSNTQLNDFTIYFSRSSCPDCSIFTTKVLTPYLEKKTSSTISYIIDCDVEGIRYKNSAYDETQWDAFKTDYGLTYSESNPSGYGRGYVPTIFNIRPNSNGNKTGSVIDGAVVFFNDSYLKQEDGTFKITETYFTSERLDLDSLTYLKISNIQTKILTGYSYGKNETSKSDYDYYQESLFNIHKDIATTFLDYYIN